MSAVRGIAPRLALGVRRDKRGVRLHGYRGIAYGRRVKRLHEVACRGTVQTHVPDAASRFAVPPGGLSDRDRVRVRGQAIPGMAARGLVGARREDAPGLAKVLAERGQARCLVLHGVGVAVDHHESVAYGRGHDPPGARLCGPAASRPPQRVCGKSSNANPAGDVRSPCRGSGEPGLSSRNRPGPSRPGREPARTSPTPAREYRRVPLP